MRPYTDMARNIDRKRNPERAKDYFFYFAFSLLYFTFFRGIRYQV